MSKKFKPDRGGFVFSTDPNFRFEDEERVPQATLPPAQQNLRVKLETKHRAGKTVTLVDGFVGTDEDIFRSAVPTIPSCSTSNSLSSSSSL